MVVGDGIFMTGIYVKQGDLISVGPTKVYG